MSKRVKIEYSFDYQYIGIGIACDEHIWKLCFEINQRLGLNLIEKEENSDFPEKSDDENIVENLLFREKDLPKVERPLAYYEDSTSHSRIEYILCKPDTDKIPRDARIFRFFFFLRSLSDSLPPAEDIIKQLKQITAVISVVDISHVQNIKNLII